MVRHCTQYLPSTVGFVVMIYGNNFWTFNVETNIGFCENTKMSFVLRTNSQTDEEMGVTKHGKGSIAYARGMINDAIAVTLAWSLQLSALRNFQDPLFVLRLTGKFPPDSIGGNIADGFRRNWRFLMSLSSISGGNFAIPNMKKYHLGLTVFLADVS